MREGVFAQFVSFRFPEVLQILTDLETEGLTVWIDRCLAAGKCFRDAGRVPFRVTASS
jgi:hypothetical protein